MLRTCWLAAFGILSICICFWAAKPEMRIQEPEGTLSRTSSSDSSASRHKTLPIKEISVGMRVPGKNPEAMPQSYGGDEPNSHGWRKIGVRMKDELGVVIDAELLRPVSWITDVGAVVGNSVWIELTEMNCAGMAQILNISACPKISSGTGSVVTGTFQHTSSEAVLVGLESLSKPLVGTPKHPFWSVSRNVFVPAQDLYQGELKWTPIFGPRARSA